MPTVQVHPRAQAVLEYWFGPDFATQQNTFFSPQKSKLWFQGGAEVDEYIKKNFSSDLEAIAEGRYDPWIETPYNGLAGIILMDQFTRNTYRGTARAFSLDTKALTWAQHLLDTGRAKALTVIQRTFLYLPFEHCETLEAQERAVALFESESAALHAAKDPTAAAAQQYLDTTLKFAKAHVAVIAKWGRFPHRNAILGRPNTPAEELGLKDGSIPRF